MNKKKIKKNSIAIIIGAWNMKNIVSRNNKKAELIKAVAMTDFFTYSTASSLYLAVFKLV